MSDVRLVLTPVASRPVSAAALEAVPGVAEVITPDLDAVPAALSEIPILVTWRWTDDWLETGVEWIQSYSAGVDQFPVDRLRESGVVLTSAVGIHDVQVSEHAFALLLGLTRGIGIAAVQQERREWRWPSVVDLADRTLGILGLGVIGETIARKGKAFGMTVIGTKRTPAGYDGAADEVVEPDQTLEVFRRSDVVVSVLPDTTETRGIVGAAELEALRGGYFVNVGRGSAVDEAALVDAMRNDVLAGAGLDVFTEEPLPADSALWDLPGVLITPHVAGASPRYGERLAKLFERNLCAYRGEAEWVNRIV